MGPVGGRPSLDEETREDEEDEVEEPPLSLPPEFVSLSEPSLDESRTHETPGEPLEGVEASAELARPLEPEPRLPVEEPPSGLPASSSRPPPSARSGQAEPLGGASPRAFEPGDSTL